MRLPAYLVCIFQRSRSDSDKKSQLNNYEEYLSNKKESITPINLDNWVKQEKDKLENELGNFNDLY